MIFSKYPLSIKFVNTDAVYGFYGQLLFGIFRFAILTKNEHVIRCLEIQLGFILRFNIRLRFEYNDFKIR